MIWLPPFPTHPGPPLDAEAMSLAQARIVRGVELWKSIMIAEIESWNHLSDFKSARDRLMHELRLGGIATRWPGVTYY